MAADRGATGVAYNSIVGAGALITQGKKIPPGSMVLGSPAKVVRELSAEEQSGLRAWAERYVKLIPHYHALGLSAPRAAVHNAWKAAVAASF